MHRVLIIIPTYNEADNIRAITQRVFSSGASVDLLVVDDNSPDGTASIVEELRGSNPRIHLLSRAQKEGLAPAYFAGFDWGIAHGYEWIGQMDADGSHLPEQLHRLLVATGGAPRPDLVIGSRAVPGGRTDGWSKARLALSSLGNMYIRILLGMPIGDATAGYRLYRGKFLSDLRYSQRVSCRGFGFQIEMTWLVQQAHGTIKEVPITFVDRVKGKSKMSKEIALEALQRVAAIAYKQRFLPKIFGK